jgi:phage terminase large subunit
MVINFKATKVFHSIWAAAKSGIYKLIVEEGSSRSSKTWSNFQVIFLLLYESPLTTCTILRDTQKSCREIVEIDFIKWLSDPMGRKKQLEDELINIGQFDSFIKDENLLKYFTRNRTNHTWTFNHNKSFIRFTGLDDEDDAMGMSQDICWINEPYKFSHEVYKQLAQRTSRFILFDWNPKQRHWVTDEKKKDNTKVLKSTFLDNPFCPEASKIQIQSYQPINLIESVLIGKITAAQALSYDIDENLSDLSKKEINELKRALYNDRTGSASAYHWLVYGKGEKSEKPNKIYSGWLPMTDSQFQQLTYSSYYGLDFGSANPSALVEVKYCDKNFFTKQRMYLPISQMTSGLADVLKSLGLTSKDIIVADSADPVRIAELNAAGLTVVPAIKGPGSVNQGITFLQSVKNHYTEESTDLEYEYDNYEWEIINNTNLDRPVKKEDHLLDADRYVKTFLQFYLGIV